MLMPRHLSKSLDCYAIPSAIASTNVPRIASVEEGRKGYTRYGQVETLFDEKGQEQRHFTSNSKPLMKHFG